MVKDIGGFAKPSRAELRHSRIGGGGGGADIDTRPSMMSTHAKESSSNLVSVASRFRDRNNLGSRKAHSESSPSKGPHGHEFNIGLDTCCQSNLVASMNPLFNQNKRKRWILIQRLATTALIAVGIAIGLMWNEDSSRSSRLLEDLSSLADLKHIKLKSSWRKSSPLNYLHSLDQVKEVYQEIFDLLPAEGFDSNFTQSNCWITKTTVAGTDHIVEKLQCIPSLYLIGVAKSGTTDIWMRLSRHPDFAKCRSIGACGHNVKEPHYWTLGDRQVYWRESELGYQPMRYKAQTSKNLTAGRTKSIAGSTRNAAGSPNYQVKLDFQNYIDFYKGFTPSLLKTPNKALIDASTDIFTFCCNGFPGPSEPLKGNKSLGLEEFITTPEVLKAVIPNPRFLLLLRDPVTRLWSDYMYFNRSGSMEAKSPSSFHHDCELAVTQLNECLAKASEKDGLDNLPAFLRSIGRDEFMTPKSNIPSFRAYLRCTDNGGWRDPQIAPPRKTLLQCPLHVSLYYYNMQFWMATFDEEFLVIRTEDYRASPWTEIDRVFDHFGLREPTLAEWRMIHDTCNVWAYKLECCLFSQHEDSIYIFFCGFQKGHCNEGKYHKNAGGNQHESKTPTADSSNGIILEETEDMLRAFYAPFNEHLAILLDDEGFLWTAEQIKEDKWMAEIALQTDPMEITLRNAEDRKKERREKNMGSPRTHRMKAMELLKSRRSSESNSFSSFLYGDNEPDSAKGSTHGGHSRGSFFNRDDPNHVRNMKNSEHAYSSFLYGEDESKYSRNQDGQADGSFLNSREQSQAHRRPERTPVGNIITGRVTSRPKGQ